MSSGNSRIVVQHIYYVQIIELHGFSLRMENSTIEDDSTTGACNLIKNSN